MHLLIQTRRKAFFIFHGAAGKSPSSRHMLQQLELVARTDATVCLTGETGTGKEVAARAIHNNSSRKNGPFIAVNCGAVPEKLIESELFGYSEGAFTGAKRKGHNGALQKPIKARFSSMKSEKYHTPCRSLCYGCCRNGKSPRSAGQRDSRRHQNHHCHPH